MPRYLAADDYQPLAWIGKYPVHAATLLVLIHVTAMIAGVIATALGYGAWISSVLAYSSAAIFQQFAFWQFVTYPFVQSPSIWFAIEMYLLFSFGREVERFIGRRAFLSLYGLLILMPPCLLTATGLFIPSRLVGSGILNFCVFVAFATVYPNVRLMFGLIVKWVAAALLGLYVLQQVMTRDWPGLLVLCASAALAFIGIRRLRGTPVLEGIPFPRGAKGRSRLKSKRLVESGRTRKDVKKTEAPEDVDAILDKISRSGIGSLTAREKTRLERASKQLAAKERPR